MGLNDSYGHVRNQILLMEPLPSVNRAYSMVLRVEKQRNVQIQFTDTSENIAMSTKTSGFGRGRGGYQAITMTNGKGRGRGLNGKIKEDKAKLVCDIAKEQVMK